ncbi:MAG TPA: SgcJ/EcaC family oxidoreductase [Polyangia bacterium]|nr:SgcJ/EcaC family oxidoreductase [Polyangia bacterium]
MSDFRDAVKALYRALLDGWNRRDAGAMAALCADDCAMVGFDGSQMNGRQEIEAALRPIFADHPTAAYVSIVRRVWMMSEDVAALTAVAGMVPPGKDQIMPERNAVQSLVAARRPGGWQVVLFQNTPAALDGRPALRDALTRELDEARRQHQR